MPQCHRPGKNGGCAGSTTKVPASLGEPVVPNINALDVEVATPCPDALKKKKLARDVAHKRDDAGEGGKNAFFSK